MWFVFDLLQHSSYYLYTVHKTAMVCRYCKNLIKKQYVQSVALYNQSARMKQNSPILKIIRMFNNCVTVFTTISFIPFVMEEWIFKHSVEEICTLNKIFAGVVGIECCFRWNHSPPLDGKHVSLTLRASQKKYVLHGTSVAQWSQIQSGIIDNVNHSRALMRVNDQLGLVPFYVFTGSWKHWQMPYTIILDKGCLMNYTKALAEDKPNTFFLFLSCSPLKEPECDYATSFPGKLCSLSSSSVKWHYLICDSWLKCFSVVL